jgi:cytochrome oxidase assembly protein ShyY1
MAGNVAAYGFVIEKLPDAQDLALPKPELPDPKAMPNNHLDYALTWFSLAGLLLLLTGYFLWTGRKARENHPHA